MGRIRSLSRSDIPSFVEVASLAYPGMGIFTPEDKQKLIERLEKQTESGAKNLFGAYSGQTLLGGMLLHDFRVNFLSNQLDLGGVGFVCVDLLHKKEKIAKELITYFEQYYREKGTAIAALYPFRPDFYRKMGYGYGSKMNQYRFAPKELPKGASKQNVKRLCEENKGELHQCYTRFALKNHGMIERSEEDMKRLFQDPKNNIFGVWQEDVCKGYCVFSFENSKPGNFISNHMLMKEFVWETREALMELCTFIHSQQDQIHQVIWNTQQEAFHHLMIDPRNGSDNLMPHVYHETNASGVGLMYKVLDIRGLFEQTDTMSFGLGSLKVKWCVTDSFANKNHEVLVHFHDGYADVRDDMEPDLTVSLSISEFSSLIMGAISITSLYRFGLVQLSDDHHLQTLHQIFSALPTPICMTGF
ncbi:GNAT family N-acetyltransferase [Bacillus tianshenii]|uniref:GNAT family N-acetyltransferase n=1 Tax=Sutcliffiella tianshenii TaxID=1463404 RepID=UPI001CD63648|nr:GNAT family N-acetyltransferase [Bacillus tianshenii]MCA1319086.1 GNAT family N-acetyltransferase [Bacillus tianshenii]